MGNRCFYRLERTFFDNRSVERAPANIWAVGDQAIFGFERTPVRLTSTKYFILGSNHATTSSAMAATMGATPTRTAEILVPRFSAVKHQISAAIGLASLQTMLTDLNILYAA